MCLILNYYLFKASRYSYGSTYINPMVSTNQKHKIDSQELQRKELKHTTKIIIKPQKEKKTKTKEEEMNKGPQNQMENEE